MALHQSCFKWKGHKSTLISEFDKLLETGTLVDCTLAAEGQYLKAHRVVLSACSRYLETLLSKHSEIHPILIIQDVKLSELKYMMDYMYRGEVNIFEDQLESFCEVAKLLQIKGFSDNGTGCDTGLKSKVLPAKKLVTASNPTESGRQDFSTDSSLHRLSKKSSTSPTLRKRRKIGYFHYDEGTLEDSHVKIKGSCGLPNQFKSIIGHNVPDTVTSSRTVTSAIQDQEKLGHVEIEDTINPSTQNLLQVTSAEHKIEKHELIEVVLETKIEHSDSANTKNIVEVLALDEDEMDGAAISNMANISRPCLSTKRSCKSADNQRATNEIRMLVQQGASAAEHNIENHELNEVVLETEIEHSESANTKNIVEVLALDEDEMDGADISNMANISRPCLSTKRSCQSADNQRATNEIRMLVQQGASAAEHKIEKHELNEVVLETEMEHSESVSTKNTVEALALDEDEMDGADISNMANISRPCLSKRSCQFADNQLATNEISMLVQQGASAPSSSNDVFTEDDNFQCTLCGKSFQYKKTLVKHQRYECGDKRLFACSLCSYTAKQTVSLRLHMINAHNETLKQKLPK